MGANWLVSIFGVNTNKIVEASLGYFFNSLLNVFWVPFLEGTPQLLARLALGMATLGVLNFLWNFGSLT